MTLVCFVTVILGMCMFLGIGGGTISRLFGLEGRRGKRHFTSMKNHEDRRGHWGTRSHDCGYALGDELRKYQKSYKNTCTGALTAAEHRGNRGSLRCYEASYDGGAPEIAEYNCDACGIWEQV